MPAAPAPLPGRRRFPKPGRTAGRRDGPGRGSVNRKGCRVSDPSTERVNDPVATLPNRCRTAGRLLAAIGQVRMLPRPRHHSSMCIPRRSQSSSRRREAHAGPSDRASCWRRTWPARNPSGSSAWSCTCILHGDARNSHERSRPPCNAERPDRACREAACHEDGIEIRARAMLDAGASRGAYSCRECRPSCATEQPDSPCLPLPVLPVLESPPQMWHVIGVSAVMKVTETGFRVASRVRGPSDAEFREAFGTEAQCRATLARLRWREGFVCPGCGHRGHCLPSRRPVHQCNRCNQTMIPHCLHSIDRTRPIPYPPSSPVEFHEQAGCRLLLRISRDEFHGIYGHGQPCRHRRPVFRSGRTRGRLFGLSRADGRNTLQGRAVCRKGTIGISDPPAASLPAEIRRQLSIRVLRLPERRRT